MKRLMLVVFGLFILSLNLFANNVSITSAPVLVDPSPTNKHIFIEFGVSWDNSWRNSTNHDAVWLFVKYRNNGGPWEHAYLGTAASDYSVGNNNGTPPAFEPGIENIGGNNRGIGVFAYRNTSGTGNVNWQNVRLKWEYGANGVDNYAQVQVQVFAIEMAYVPQGTFRIGDGASISRFHEGGNQNNTFQISTAAIEFGNTAGKLWAMGSWDAPSGTLSPSYPSGYNAFYCMKYSITQQQYADFLNTLTRAQQNARTATNLSAGTTTVTNIFVMSGAGIPTFRNGIRCQSTISANDPVTFYCDLNNNGTMNENNDGLHIACNYLSWADGAAYASWAGLRPITETEYEKACRGTATPVGGAYAWGTTSITAASSINNSGTPNETANSGANCIYNNVTGVQGPMRVGCFATSTSTREAAGASAYGIMEMTGNLWERIVSIGSVAGRTFNGNNGTGTLNTAGNAAEPSWPGTNAVGTGLRGNHWKGNAINGSISIRDNGNYETAIRNEMFGFRAGRGVN